MFRVGLIEESTMRFLEVADFDPASQNPRVPSEPEEKWSGKACAERCLGKNDRNHTKEAFPECSEDERKLPRQRVFSH